MATYKLLVTIKKELEVTVEADTYREAEQTALVECLTHGEIVDFSVEDMAVDRDQEENVPPDEGRQSLLSQGCVGPFYNWSGTPTAYAPPRGGND
jgi:hypothetical protein